MPCEAANTAYRARPKVPCRAEYRARAPQTQVDSDTGWVLTLGRGAATGNLAWMVAGVLAEGWASLLPQFRPRTCRERVDDQRERYATR